MLQGRGQTHIRDIVVAKIAEQAASEVATVVGGQRRLAGVPVGQRDRPRVSVTVLDSLVTARVAAALTYPTALRESTSRIRQHVTDRVQELTGMRVGAVDVAVTALVPRQSAVLGDSTAPAAHTASAAHSASADPAGED